MLVLQRGVERAFSDGEVVLATALAAVINHAIERGQERERRQARSADRRAVRLAGQSIVDGAAMGRAELLPTLSALTGSEPGEKAAPAKIEATIERLYGELRKAAAGANAAAAGELRSLSLILEDLRFRAGLAQGCGAPEPLKALSALARSYARVAFTVPPSDRDGAEMISDRAAEIEDLCVFVYAASLRGRPLVRSGAVVVAERLRPFAAIHAIMSGAVGFVVEGEMRADGATAALVRAAGLPLLASVGGVFSWLQPEDLLVIEVRRLCASIRPRPRSRTFVTRAAELSRFDPIDGAIAGRYCFLASLQSDIAAKLGRAPRSLIISALLLALLIGGVYSFIALSTANNWLRHTDEVRVGIAQLRSTVLDAETGLRGYLITGERDFLAPYDRARDQWREQLDQVRAARPTIASSRRAPDVSSG